MAAKNGIRRHTVAVDVTLRTLLYTVGVLLVLLIEKAFETRQEAGGLGEALVVAYRTPRDSPYLCRATASAPRFLVS